MFSFLRRSAPHGVRPVLQRLPARARCPRQRVGAHDAHARARVCDPRRSLQLEVRVVRRAPRARRVLAHVGTRDVLHLRHRPDRTDPRRLRDHEPVPSGQPPNPQRRARRHARPRHQQSLRVGHRARRGQPRDGDVRPVDVGDQSHVGRGRPRDPAHVGAAGLHVRGRVLPGRDAPQHPPQAPRHRAPPALGRLREPRHVHEGRRARHRGHRLQLRARLQPEGSDRRLQGGHRQLHRAARPVHQRQRDDDQRRGLRLGPDPCSRDRHVRRAGVPQHDGEPLPRHDAAPARCGEVARHPLRHP